MKSALTTGLENYDPAENGLLKIEFLGDKSP